MFSFILLLWTSFFGTLFAPASTGYQAGTLMNFAVAGALGGVAAHNYGVRPVQ